MSKLLCGLTACFVFPDPVPNIPVEQQHQKTIVSALPPSPVGDVRPSTHVAPSEKPCELGVSGESCFFFAFFFFFLESLYQHGSIDLLSLALA